MNIYTKHIKYWITLCIVIGFVSIIKSQSPYMNIGHPFVKHYSKTDYQGGIQNWDIDQSKNGKMLFANNWGLMTFDGKRWNLKPGLNGMMTRQIAMNEDNRLFFGGQNTFGYYYTKNDGTTNYTLLSDSLDIKDRFFGAIWGIKTFNSSVFFRSSRKIIRYKDNTIKTWETDTYFPFIGELANDIIVFNSQKGFYKLDGDSLVLVNEDKEYIDEHIINIRTLDNGSNIIFTEKNGLLSYQDNKIIPWKIDADQFLRKNRITSVSLLSNQRIVIGTRFGGIIIIDENGKTLELLNMNSGLTSNNNICLFVDKDNNLWAAQEKGIDYVLLQSPYRIINDPNILDGIGYTVKIYNNKVYFGTSTGLYTKKWLPHYDPLRADGIVKVKGSDGLVRGLDIIGGELLLSHHDGIYRILDDKAIKIKGANIGSWSFISIPGNDKWCINGNYRGLALYQKINGKWQLDHQMDGFDFTSRNILWHDGFVWVAHPYQGIYKIELTKDFQQIKTIISYDSFLGLPENSYYNIITIGNKLYCGTKSGLYVMNMGKFELSDLWINLFNNESVKYLHSDHNKDLYYLTKNEFGLIKNYNGSPNASLKKEPIKGPKDWFVGGFEYIYPIGDEMAFISTEDGFVLYQHEPSKIDSLKIVFNNITIRPAPNRIENLNLNSINEIKLNPDYKSIRFDFTVPSFKEFNPTLYQYRMLGYEDHWSNWNQENIKEYTNLKAGDYNFQVKAKSFDSNENDLNQGKFSQILNYEFEVLPIWYLSNFAKWMYILLFCLFSAGLIFFPRKKHKAEKQALEQKQELIIEEHKEKLEERQEVIEEHKEVIEKTEIELHTIKTQRLQEDLQHKNKELMSITMHLTQKNEVIQNMKEALIKLSKSSSQPETTKTIKKLVRVIQSHDNSDKDWEQFTKHFDQVHTGFFHSLREKYPKLTPRDIRLCAYLRLNLSTKEIAPLMGISVRGVEISRYRLRKKLGLEKDVNLVKFLMKYE